jgi:hypothetical protein
MVRPDDQREGFRQHGRIDNVDPGPGVRDVANHAIDAATRAKGQGALFQHAVSLGYPFGTYCAKNPSISIVNAAETILGK